MQLVKIFDRPIAYHRVFVDLAGSVTAAVMLSQAFYWAQRTDDPEGWFYKTQDEWQDETGLSRYEQEGARTRLRELGLWEEKKAGLPCKLFFRIVPEKFNELFANSSDCNAQTGMRKTSRLACGKVADRPAENQQAIIGTETTTETTTDIAPPAAGAETPSVSPVENSAPEAAPESDSQASKKRERPRDLLFDAVTTVCRINQELMTEKQRGQVNQACGFIRRAHPNHSPESIAVLVDYVGRWWYAEDWRGKTGQPPDPARLREVWDTAKTYWQAKRAGTDRPKRGLVL